MELHVSQLVQALFGKQTTTQRETRESYFQRHSEFDPKRGLVQTSRRRESNQGSTRRLRGNFHLLEILKYLIVCLVARNFTFEVSIFVD